MPMLLAQRGIGNDLACTCCRGADGDAGVNTGVRSVFAGLGGGARLPGSAGIPGSPALPGCQPGQAWHRYAPG